VKECGLFDFDGTVTYPDTTKYLILELLKKRPLRFFLLFKSFLVIKTLKDPGRIQLAKNTAIGILIKGLSVKEIESVVNVFHKKIRTLTRPVVMDRIKKFSEEGKDILIVTASPVFAVNNFFKEMKVSVLGTEFSIKDGIYNGNLETASCYGHEKVNRIEGWLLNNNPKIEFVESWSDSLSDKPMMKLSNNRYWVVDENKEVFEKEDPLGLYVNE